MLLTDRMFLKSMSTKLKFNDMNIGLPDVFRIGHLLGANELT